MPVTLPESAVTFTGIRINTAKKQFKGVGLKALRKKAGWGNDNLRLILKNSF